MSFHTRSLCRSNSTVSTFILAVLALSSCKTNKAAPIGPSCEGTGFCSSGYVCLADNTCARFVPPTCSDADTTSCAILAPGTSCTHDLHSVTPCHSNATSCDGGCSTCDCPPVDPTNPASPLREDCGADELVWGACNASTCTLGQVHSCAACGDDCEAALGVMPPSASNAAPTARCAKAPASNEFVCIAAAASVCAPGRVDANGDLGSAESNGCECATTSAAGWLCGVNSACDARLDTIMMDSFATSEATESGPADCTIYYQDNDHDGHGAGLGACLCTKNPLFNAEIASDDCDDAKSARVSRGPRTM